MKRILIPLIIIVNICISYSQIMSVDYDRKKGGKSLFPVRVNGYYGFRDSSGQIIIPAKYSFAKEFKEGRAAVSMNGKWGFIDTCGKLIIPCIYKEYACCDVDEIFSYYFHESMALVYRNNRYYYIDPNGVEKIKVDIPKLQMISDFSYRRARFAIGEKEFENFGFINQRGKIVIKPTYHRAEDFSEGLALVGTGYKYGLDGDLRYGYIDTSGLFIIKPEFISGESFNRGRAKVGNGEREFYIDKTGKEIK